MRELRIGMSHESPPVRGALRQANRGARASNELGTLLHWQAEQALLAGACYTIAGEPVYPVGDLVTPEAYAANWAKRSHGTRVKSVGYYLASYVSIHVETDCGVELEVSALVDLRPGGEADLDDYRCRVADGAEVELDDATLMSLRDRLVDAAITEARR